MPNYQEGEIHKIYNTVNDDIYVGSTTQKLCERTSGHRRYSKPNRVNRPLYQAFVEHGVDNFYIELIEKYPCNDREELHKKEGEFIRELRPSLNKVIAGRTRQEYYTDNKEVIMQKRKEHIKQHREEHLQQRKYNYEKNIERERQICREYHGQHKSYYNQPIDCECGCIVTRCCLTRHRKTKKHIELMSE